MAQIPEDLKYTAEHEWVETSSPATVGITDTAQDALGDIVYLELPAVGDLIVAGAVIGEIESTKSVSELFSPVNGTVVEVNQAAIDEPAGRDRVGSAPECLLIDERPRVVRRVPIVEIRGRRFAGWRPHHGGAMGVRGRFADRSRSCGHPGHGFA